MPTLIPNSVKTLEDHELTFLRELAYRSTLIVDDEIFALESEIDALEAELIQRSLGCHAEKAMSQSQAA